MKIISVISICLLMAISAQAQTQPTPIRDTTSREAAQLAAVGFAPPQAPQGRQRSWPARHPMLTGTLVGVGVGFPIGAATCKAPGLEGPCSYYTAHRGARDGANKGSPVTSRGRPSGKNSSALRE